MAFVLFVGLDREGSIIAALVALIVAALTVSVGAWILLARERRAETPRVSPDPASTQVLPATPPGHTHD